MTNILLQLLLLLAIPFGVIAQGEQINLPMGRNCQQVTFAPSGEYIGVSRHHNITFWLAGSKGKYTEINTEFSKVNSFAFSPNGKEVLYSGEEDWIRRVLFKRQYAKTQKGDENFVAVASHSIVLRDLDSLKKLQEFVGHTKDVMSIRVDKLGKIMVSGGKDNTVKIWNYQTGKLIRTLSWHKDDVLALDISPDNKFIASAGADKKIYITEIATGKPKYEIPVHKDWIRDVAFSPDGRLLASASDDGSILLMDLSDNHLEWESMGGGRHKGRVYTISFSADSRYLVSGGQDESFIIWDIEKRVFRSQNQLNGKGSVTYVDFDPKGKYLATTSYLDNKMIMWNVKNLNITVPIKYKDKDDTNPPMISIISPVVRGSRLLLANDQVLVKGMAIDEFGVHSIYINNVKTQLKEGNRFDVVLDLVIGENPIKIRAVDINGNESVREMTIIRRENEELLVEESEGKTYLLTIGIDNYTTYPQLYNAVMDVKAVEKLLTDKYSFSENEVTTIYNERATQQQIIDAFTDLIKKLQWNDKVLIYFSGHGIFNNELNEGYWLPIDAKEGEVSTFISNSTLLKFVEEMKAKHILVIADACFSGSLFNESQRGKFEDEVGRYRSRWAVTSGRLEPVADGVMGQHSPFCNAILTFLGENELEKVAVSDLVQYVKKNVPETANQIPRGNPLKNAGDEGGEFIFILKEKE